RLDLDRVEDLLRDVDEVLLVLLGEDEDLDAHAVRGEQLLLHASDRKNATTERDLPGHRDLATHAPTRQSGDDGRGHRDARRGAVLRERSRGNMDVHGVVFEEPLRDTELSLVPAHVAERGTSGLLHDLAD